MRRVEETAFTYHDRPTTRNSSSLPSRYAEHRVTRVAADGDTTFGKHVSSPVLQVHFLMLNRLQLDRRVGWRTNSSLNGCVYLEGW